MQEIVVIDGEIELENTLDGEVELEAITDLDPEVVLSAGGGVTPSGTIEITENGTYNVRDYAEADVDVPGITPTGTKQININSNGTTTEDVTDYANAEINVNVPASAVDTGTKNINTNGTHDVIGYASASVAVPNSYSASDEGKVVSNGALVAQTSDTVTANDTYDTTLINSLTVNVSGGGGAPGGLANMLDITDSDIGFAYLLSALKNGDTAGGTVTYTSAFANTEQLVLSTGLTELHGFFFAITDSDLNTDIGNYQSGKMFCLIRSNDEDTSKYITITFSVHNTWFSAVNHTLGTAYNGAPENGVFRIDGGDIYYTARYNRNSNFQFIYPNHLYDWLAW